MTAIRYRVHFTALAVASILFWFTQDLRLPVWISNFNLLHFALMGAFHATTIVVSLRNPTSIARAVAFVTIASGLSVGTPFAALVSGFVLVPFADILHQYDLGAHVFLGIGSLIGSAAYWLLVRQFWLQTLQRIDLLRTITCCTLATTLALLSFTIFGGYERGEPKINPDLLSPILTIPWWLAFSGSLYWSEASKLRFKAR